MLQANLPPVVVPFGSARTIDALVSQWRADISAEALATALVSSDGPVRSSRRSGAALRRSIWDPVVLHLGRASRVFIVTDGLLNLVPFSALPVGQRSYLLESHMVLHYLLQSGTWCLHWQSRHRNADFWRSAVHRLMMRVFSGAGPQNRLAA